MKLSLPNKAQLLKAVEHAFVGAGAAFLAAWLKQPDPFSKAGILAAWGAAAGFVYGLVKGFVL